MTADPSQRPNHTQLLEDAELLHAAGMLADAEAVYRQLLEIDPTHARALHQLAIIAQLDGRSSEALGLIDQALATDPRFDHALNSRGVVLAAMGRLAMALDSYDEALTVTPDFAAALANRGDVLMRLGQYAAALASYERAIALDPSDPQAMRGRLIALGALDRPADMVAACDDMLARGQDIGPAQVGRGHGLLALGRRQEAAVSFAAAATASAEFPEAHLSRAAGQLMLGRWREARAEFDQLLATQPDHTVARFNRALCDLALGDYERGWREYDWRWQTRVLLPVRRDFGVPQWTGAEDITGKTILLHGEQGFGDTLQFCRYAPLVAARANVVLEVPGPLVRLLRTLPGGGHLIATGETVPPVDLHCPLLSLPRAFQTTVATIPAGIPYLAADPADLATWRSRLAPLTGLGVGLCWAGNSRREDPDSHQTNLRRSMPFTQLAPLADVSGVHFISLRKELPPEHGGTLAAGRTLHDWTRELRDFADTAALIAALDLVITVDTAVAHVAGALGKPVWILNRFDACWRWLTERDDSPWYPTVRLFRQPDLGDWDGMMRAVRDALAEFQARRAASVAGDADQA